MWTAFLFHAGKRMVNIFLQPGKFLPDLVYLTEAFLRHPLVIELKREYHPVRTLKPFLHGVTVCFVMPSAADMLRIDFRQAGQSSVQGGSAADFHVSEFILSSGSIRLPSSS